MKWGLELDRKLLEVCVKIVLVLQLEPSSIEKAGLE